MNFFFRVDSSHSIGSGHVVRCLSLARTLTNIKESSIQFITSDNEGNLAHLIEKNGFKVHFIESSRPKDSNYHELNNNWELDAKNSSEIIKMQRGITEWLIVDNYGLDINWEKYLRPLVKRIMVIDDLANRKHECDLLLDQNLHNNNERIYSKLIPKTSKKFIGPKYAFIDEKFENKSLIRKRTGELESILVYLGGSDTTHQLIKIISALKILNNRSFSVDLVLGNNKIKKDNLSLVMKGAEGINVIDSTDEMQKLISRADLAIGTCGISAWERCLLGLPTIVIITAENQREDAEILDSIGAIKNLGSADDVTTNNFVKAIEELSSDSRLLRRMSIKSLSVMEKRYEAKKAFQKEFFS